MSKIYFASDFHLGIPDKATSLKREQALVRWLDMVSADASEIYLIGDIFDFWFEYKHAVPRGYTRLLGKIADIRDKGIPMFVFTGNHDLWMRDYFEQEFGIPVFREPIQRTYSGKKFVIGHGDGLGPGDTGYKLMKKVFTNPVSKFIYRWLHPDIGIPLANFFSRSSREAQMGKEVFLGAEKEWLVQYCNVALAKDPADYYIFGHRHLPIDHVLKNGVSRYINLGDWKIYRSYAIFDGTNLSLRFFENDDQTIYS